MCFKKIAFGGFSPAPGSGEQGAGSRERGAGSGEQGAGSRASQLTARRYMRFAPPGSEVLPWVGADQQTGPCSRSEPPFGAGEICAKTRCGHEAMRRCFLALFPCVAALVSWCVVWTCLSPSASGSELSLVLSRALSEATTATPCWDAPGRLLCSALSCSIQLACVGVSIPRTMRACGLRAAPSVGRYMRFAPPGSEVLPWVGADQQTGPCSRSEAPFGAPVARAPPRAFEGFARYKLTADGAPRQDGGRQCDSRHPGGRSDDAPQRASFSSCSTTAIWSRL
jgi:hypothetical protein